MKKKIISTALALAMAATSTVGLASTAEARGRHHGYYSNGYDGHYYRRRHHNHNGDAIAAGVLGFALGAIVVGSTQRRTVRRDYDGGRYYDSGYDRYDSRYDHVRRCEARYRSYDRRTDTFIGRDGREYYCNL
ncbi:MAG: BA14K family protein [Alphaproteobacteria bacterium]|nr:BA14K family protein [Alphaproteobacteria bacterium]